MDENTPQKPVGHESTSATTESPRGVSRETAGSGRVVRSPVTYEQVAEVCAAAEARGEDIVIRRIRKETGGAVETVSEHIKRWRREKDERLAAGPDPIPNELRVALARAFAVEREKGEATKLVELDEAEQRVQEYVEDLQNMQTAVDTQAEELNSLRDALATAQKNAAAAQQAAAVEQGMLKSRAEQAEEGNRRLQDKVAELTEALGVARNASARVAALESEGEQARRELQEARGELRRAEKATATAEGRADTAEALQRSSDGRLQRAEERVAEIEKELAELQRLRMREHKEWAEAAESARADAFERGFQAAERVLSEARSSGQEGREDGGGAAQVPPVAASRHAVEKRA